MNPVTLHDKTFSPFLDPETIANRIREMADEMVFDYGQKCPVFVIVLKGAFLFGSDLFRAYKGAAEVSFVRFSSYHGTQSSGEIRELIGMDDSLKGRDIVLVEDIVDTGLTMSHMLEKARAVGVSSVRVATLLFKPEACKVPLKIDYIGFKVSNEFLVGYGLDYNELGRNLECLYKLSN